MVNRLKNYVNALLSNIFYKNKQNKNVDEVTIPEPTDNGIVSQETLSNNIYHRIVYIMKLSTQEYYNMRTTLGLKCA